MTHSAIVLIVEALAVFRLTRLVTTDTVTAPVRDGIHERATLRLVKRDPFAGTVTESKTVQRRGVWAWAWEFVSCSWCVSVWAGGGVVAMMAWQGGWFQYVAAALALSTISGAIAERL